MRKLGGHRLDGLDLGLEAGAPAPLAKEEAGAAGFAPRLDVPVVPVGSKEQRAAAIVPTVESGACYLPEGAVWAADVVEEFAGFLGAAKHDDIVDCATYAVLELNTSSALERLEALGRLDSRLRPEPAGGLPLTVEGWAR